MSTDAQPGEDLTLRQRKFVAKYLETGNATEAARFAGYKGDDATMRSIGSENLTKPNIRTAIDAQLEAWKVGAERVWIFHRQVLDSTPEDFYDILDLENLPEWARSGVVRMPMLNLDKARKRGKLGLLKSIAVSDKGIKLEFYDKHASAEAVSRMLGLAKPEKLEVTGNDGGPITLNLVQYAPQAEAAEEPHPEPDAAIPDA